jgi:hypothetical protein
VRRGAIEAATQLSSTAPTVRRARRARRVIRNCWKELCFWALGALPSAATGASEGGAGAALPQAAAALVCARSSRASATAGAGVTRNRQPGRWTRGQSCAGPTARDDDDDVDDGVVVVVAIWAAPDACCHRGA